MRRFASAVSSMAGRASLVAMPFGMRLESSSTQASSDEPTELEVETLPPAPEEEQKEAEVLSEKWFVGELENKFGNIFGAKSEDIMPNNDPYTESKRALMQKKREKIDSLLVRTTTMEEEVQIDMAKYAHARKQHGAYVESETKDNKIEVTDLRKRRAVERVTPFTEPYVANETSFRRLPTKTKLPNEWELRMLYPRSTNMNYEVHEAHCADLSSHDVDEEPDPIRYCMWVPPNYDPKKTYPHMVCIPDYRGMPTDFDDMCANFWERPQFMKGLLDNEMVLIAPIVNVKRSMFSDQETTIAKFVDWLVANKNVEHGKVHLFGKGFGASLALRTIQAHGGIAHSCIGIMGRSSQYPIKHSDRMQPKRPNMMGVHTLMISPNEMHKTEPVYKFKSAMDFLNIKPAVRHITYAEVRDHQLYYAVNPIEFWNYVSYFRSYHSQAVTEYGKFYWKEVPWAKDGVEDGEVRAKELKDMETRIRRDKEHYGDHEGNEQGDSTSS